MAITWEDARSYITSGNLHLLKRSAEGAKKYQKHKQTLAGDISIDVCYKLQWDPQEIVELNEVRFPTHRQKLEAIFSSRNLFKMTINDFPYDFEPRIQHLLIWSKIALPLYVQNTETVSDHEVYSKISKFLIYNLETRYHIDNHDYLFFVNYNNLQSVKGISHIHLLLHTDKVIADKILSDGLEPYVE